jgi:hypothetical protein
LKVEELEVWSITGSIHYRFGPIRVSVRWRFDPIRGSGIRGSVPLEV